MAVIFDCEIKKMILGRNEQMQPDLQYCMGWTDYRGMGVSVVCAFDTTTNQMHTLQPDNPVDADILQGLFNRADYIVGFNNHSFDNKLLAAFDFIIRQEKSYDIYEQVIKAAGLENASFADRKGYRLDDLAVANSISGKLAGGGALAPALYQRGMIEQLHAYCEQDVLITEEIFERIMHGDLLCPRTGRTLNIQTPFAVLGGTQAGLF